MGIADAAANRTAPVTAASEPRVKASRVVTTRLVDGSELTALVDNWQALADSAVTANVFYEPWMLLPALRHLSRSNAPMFLLVFGPPVRKGAEPLWGFFPVQLQPKCFGLPVKTLSLWQHEYCFLTTPLIHREHVPEVVGAFWRWFESNPLSARVLDSNHLSADGPFHHVWSDYTLGRTSVILVDYPRASLVPAADGAEAYVARLVTRKHHDEFRRLERRLSELGTISYSRIDDPAEVERFVTDFLEIELRGWKGIGDGGAFARREETAAFFREITTGGFARGRSMLLSLNLDGRRIALKHNLLAADGMFTFKIAFDEAFAKHSPGLLLELENIRRAHDTPGIKWLDSCATPRHPMANRIWGERRMIRRTLISDSSTRGDLFLSVFPLLRWSKHSFAENHIPAYLQKLTSI